MGFWFCRNFEVFFPTFKVVCLLSFFSKYRTLTWLFQLKLCWHFWTFSNSCQKLDFFDLFELLSSYCNASLTNKHSSKWILKRYSRTVFSFQETCATPNPNQDIKIQEAMENFVFPVNLQGMQIFCQMAISQNIQLCAIFKLRCQTKYWSNQHETNSRNRAFWRGILLFCETFHWTAYFDKSKGVVTWSS